VDCIELSIESLLEQSRNLAHKIKNKYNPDIVIFIARGGYLIGKAIGDEFKIPLLGITAERKGNKIKELVSPILPYIPHGERNVKLLNTEINLKDFKNILIVDDSVDTGMSMIAVINKIKELNPNAVLKTAALNILDNSEENVKIDFYIWKNIIMRTPMSKDSKEYKIFNNIYILENK
jgi:hypoxanthine phosphoribosyltransferase